MSLALAINNPGNFVIIAGDGRVTRGGKVLRENHPKLTILTGFSSIFISGAQDYCEILRKEIESKVNDRKSINEVAQIVKVESSRIQERFQREHPYYLSDNKAAIAVVLAYFDQRSNDCGFIEFCHTDGFVPHVAINSNAAARGLKQEDALRYLTSHFNPSESIESIINTFEYAESLDNGIGGAITLHVLSKDGINERTFKRKDVALGDNVTMGPNATISWSQVTSKPDIPTVPGYITATKITSTTIETPTIFGGTIAIGSNNDIFKADSNGIYLGHSTFANAPFSVSMDGTLTAKNGIFQGEIISSTITGSTIRTAPTNADRLELSGNGLVSKNALGEKNGIAIDSGNFSSLDFYYRDELRGSLTHAAGNLSLTAEMGSIIIAPSTHGKTTFIGHVDFSDADVTGFVPVFG